MRLGVSHGDDGVVVGVTYNDEFVHDVCMMEKRFYFFKVVWRDTGFYRDRRRVPSVLYRMSALHGQD